MRRLFEARRIRFGKVKRLRTEAFRYRLDPLADLDQRSAPDLDEDADVEDVHDGQRKVEVEDARRYLQDAAASVLRVADGRWNRSNTVVDEVMPADDWYDPQRRQHPDLHQCMPIKIIKFIV